MVLMKVVCTRQQYNLIGFMNINAVKYSCVRVCHTHLGTEG